MFETDERNQYYATLCGNLISLIFGCATGWPSANLLILQSDHSPLLAGKLSVDQVSWVVSLLCIGGLIGNITFGWLTDTFGRKRLLMFCAVPSIVSCLLLIFGTNVIYLYIARLLCGFSGGGAYYLLPLYVAEISSDRVRGNLGSMLVFMSDVGMLFAFIIGNFFTYATQQWIFLIFPIIFFIGFFSFPESPQFLLSRGRDKESEKSLIYFRNLQQKTPADILIIQTEIEKIRVQLKEKSEGNERLTVSDFTTIAARKSLFISIILIALNQLCGIFAMISYTASIFAEAGSNLSPNISAIVIAVIKLLGSYFSTFLVDRAGRKILLAVSLTGTGTGLMALSCYSLLKLLGIDMSGFSWIPIASFSFAIFIAALGILTLPFLILSEIIPERIRSSGISSCMSFLWLLAFVMMKYYPILSSMFGMHTCLFIFSISSFSGAVFVVIVLPETKGKSFEEITKLLEK